VRLRTLLQCESSKLRKERRYVRDIIEVEHLLGEFFRSIRGHACQAHVGLEFGEQFIIAQWIIGMPFGMISRASRDQTGRAPARATTDVAPRGRGIGPAFDAGDKILDGRGGRNFREQLARRHFTVRERNGDRPLHAELRGDAGGRREAFGRRTADHVVCLRTDDEFDAFGLMHSVTEFSAQPERGADRGMGEPARRVRFERKPVDFKSRAEVRRRASRI